MARPVTLFTGQWADLSLADLLPKVKDMGYDGVELACWGDHFDVQKALNEDGYVEGRWDLLKQHGMVCHAISNHLAGQAVCDLIDERHQSILSPHVWGDGDPEGVRQRAAQEMIDTGKACRKFLDAGKDYMAGHPAGSGRAVVNGFTGSSIWHSIYAFPPTNQEYWQKGFDDFAARFTPILDAYDAVNVDFALEVHPTEIAFDIGSAARALEAVKGHKRFGFNYDPSHLGYQGVDYVKFIRDFADRIFHVHMKDAWWGHGDGTVGVFGGHADFTDARRFWDFRSVGRGDTDFEEIIVALNDIRYSGPLSVEWEDGRMDRFHGAAESCEFTRSLDFAPSDVVFDSAFDKENQMYPSSETKTNTIMATKVGVIGAGGMLQYHVPGFRQGGGEVVAIADVNEAAAQASADQWEIPNVFGDVGEMLASDIDAVSIIVPNKFHAPLSVQALEAGKHVFCEKPPALNATEVVGMKEVAEKAGKTLMFNFNNRARPESQAMMGYIRDGVVGTINSAQSQWIRRTGIPGFGGWFTTKALSGGGPLIDLLHMIDLSLYFMGYPDPAHVLGTTYNDFITDPGHKGPWGIPDNAEGTTDVEAAAHGLVTFKTGQVLSLRTSWAEMNEREVVSVVFQGSKAGGKVERLFGIDGLDETAIDSCELYVQENGNSVNRSIVTEACEDMGRIGSAANFVETIEGASEPLNTPDQALKLMQIIDALFASADSGAPVSL